MKRAVAAGALVVAVTLTGCQHAWTPPPSTLPTPVYSVIDLAPPPVDPAVAAAQAAPSAPAPKAAGAHAAAPHLGGGLPGNGIPGNGVPGGGIGRAFGNLNLGGGKNNGG